MEKKGGKKRIKIVLKEGEKFFCLWDVDMKGDLLSQGCRRISEQPDAKV